MKNLPFFRSALVAICCSLMMASCFSFLQEDTADDFVVEPQPVFDNFGVATAAPDVSSDPVEFRGAITVNEDEVELTYGFMWYDPNDPASSSNPTRIVVGTSDQTFTFTAEVESIPIGVPLVVCAFVDNGSTATPQMVIGDEVTFTRP